VDSTKRMCRSGGFRGLFPRIGIFSGSGLGELEAAEEFSGCSGFGFWNADFDGEVRRDCGIADACVS
jgi:hypothetical protein